MASWGNFGAPNNRAPSATTATAWTDNSAITNFNFTSSSASNGNPHLNTNIGQNNAGAAGPPHDLFGSCDQSVSGFLDNVVDRTISNDRRAFPPRTNLTNNAFATASQALNSPFCTTPGISTTDVSSFHPTLPPFPPFPPSPQFTQPTPFTSAPYLAQQPIAVPLGQFNPGFGGNSPYEGQENFQLPARTNFWDGTQNTFPPIAAPLSLSTPSQSHMSNANSGHIPQPTQSQSIPRVFDPARGLDEAFLNALVSQDFSSPSLPPLSSPHLPPAITLPSFDQFGASGRVMPLSSNRRRIPGRTGPVDVAKEEPDLEVHSGIDRSIPLGVMPPSTRRRGAIGATESPGRKRRTSTTSPSSRPIKSRRKEMPLDSDQLSPLDDDDDASKLAGYGNSETVDLSNATEVPPELMAPKVDNRIKIGKFQCVICMDDTTALTVTHCGHLFCSECLHSSLHIDTMKRTCPVCRSKVDLKDKKGKTVKSFYHLELKVMTATKKGKRPAGA